MSTVGGMPSAGPLDLTQTHVMPGLVRLSLTGDVDMANAPVLQDAILSALDQPGISRLEVEVAALRFIDSGGVNALVGGARSAGQRQVEFRVLNPRGQVLRVLEILGVLDYLGAKHSDGDAPGA